MRFDMRKLVFCALTFLSCNIASALPLGNPAEASLLYDGLFMEGVGCEDEERTDCFWGDRLSVRVGYYGDFIFNRHMRESNSDRKTIEKTRIITNAGYLAANVYELFDLFATFGATKLKIDTNTSAFSTIDGVRLGINSFNDFSWSVGLRGTIFEYGCTTCGVEAQYFYTRPAITRSTLGGFASDYPAERNHMKYSEWQVGIGISQRINQLVPYVGGSYSRARIDMRNIVLDFTDGTTILLANLESKGNGCGVVGVSFIDCEKVSVNAEFRFCSERALYINGQIRF